MGRVQSPFRKLRAPEQLRTWGGKRKRKRVLFIQTYERKEKERNHCGDRTNLIDVRREKGGGGEEVETARFSIEEEGGKNLFHHIPSHHKKEEGKGRDDDYVIAFKG